MSVPEVPCCKTNLGLVCIISQTCPLLSSCCIANRLRVPTSPWRAKEGSTWTPMGLQAKSQKRLASITLCQGTRAARVSKKAGPTTCTTRHVVAAVDRVLARDRDSRREGICELIKPRRKAIIETFRRVTQSKQLQLATTHHYAYLSPAGYHLRRRCHERTIERSEHNWRGFWRT